MQNLVVVAAVNFCFLDKGEGGGGMNYSSRGRCRGGGGGGSRGRGRGEPRGRGGGPNIGWICSYISATVTSTMRIALLISSSRLYMSVRVYPVILSWSDTSMCVGIGEVSNLALLYKLFIKSHTSTSVVLLAIFAFT